MTALSGRRGPAQISDIANAVLDPILARRAGINTLVLGAWDEIAGPDFADCTRPERIKWPRGGEAGDDGQFTPGVLTVACEGARALFLMHAKDELIARLNAFFGFPAVADVRIVQKPVAEKRRTVTPAHLAAPQARRLDGMLCEIDDPHLKAALARLGQAVLAKR